MKTLKEFLKDEKIDDWMKNPDAIEGFQQRFDEDWKDVMLFLSSKPQKREKSINEKK